MFVLVNKDYHSYIGVLFHGAVYQTNQRHNDDWVKLWIARLVTTSLSQCCAAGADDTDAVAAFACQAQT